VRGGPHHTNQRGRAHINRSSTLPNGVPIAVSIGPEFGSDHSAIDAYYLTRPPTDRRLITTKFPIVSSGTEPTAGRPLWPDLDLEPPTKQCSVPTNTRAPLASGSSVTDDTDAIENGSHGEKFAPTVSDVTVPGIELGKEDNRPADGELIRVPRSMIESVVILIVRQVRVSLPSMRNPSDLLG
jgi:hypothetical protein